MMRAAVSQLHLRDNPLNTTIDKYLQRAIKKELTVDQATTALTGELNEALKRGKDQVG